MTDSIWTFDGGRIMELIDGAAETLPSKACADLATAVKIMPHSRYVGAQEFYGVTAARRATWLRLQSTRARVSRLERTIRHLERAEKLTSNEHTKRAIKETEWLLIEARKSVACLEERMHWR